jgi:2-methylcitrate dehydratase PrpD
MATAATDPGFGITDLVCGYAANLSFEDLPPEVISTAKRLVLDSLGSALAGTTLGDGGPEVTSVVRASGGNPEATILGFDEKVSAVMAALANGATVHALNYDSIGAWGGHPGTFALTAPLAVAERQGGVSGREFIASLVAGVEVEMRAVSALLRAGVDTKGRFLEGQILSYLGATLSAGRVLRLSPEEMDSALGVMLMQVSGTRQVVIYGDPPAKGIYSAFPNHGGVLSALLAKEGLSARCQAIEGGAGLYAMFYDGVYDPEAFREALGEEFHMLNAAFKPWPTSGLVHPFIDGALQIQQEHDIDPAMIESVHLTGDPQLKNWFEPVEERRRPTSAASAANSVVFGTAKALINRAVTLQDFTPEGMTQPDVLALTKKMDHSLDPSLGIRAGVIEVVTTSGARIARRQEAPLGQPDNPLSDDQLVQKFRDCAQHSARPIAEEALDRVIDFIDHLEDVPDVAVMTALLGGRKTA